MANHLNDLYRLQYNSECDERSGNHPSGLDFGDWINAQPPIDIEPEQVAISSWVKVAAICKCWTNVSTAKWVETMSPEYLQSLKFEDWEKIADASSLSVGWAVNKYKQFKN